MPASNTDEMEIRATLAHLRATLPKNPTSYEVALLTTVHELAHELARLQQLVRQQEQGGDPALPSAAPQPRVAALPPVQPRKQLSIDYWLANVPEFDEPLTAEELATFQDKPRVRPEDIELTAEDLARQQRPYVAPGSPWTWTWTDSVALIIGLVVLVVVVLRALSFLLR